jgi:hypothetical protein
VSVTPAAPPGPLGLTAVADVVDAQLVHFEITNAQGDYVTLYFGDGEADTGYATPLPPTIDVDHRYAQPGTYSVTAHSAHGSQNDTTISVTVLASSYVPPVDAPPASSETVTSDPLSIDWRPTVDEVAALLRARTKDASGNEVGTFTDKTRPTDAEVEMLITNGCAKIASLVGWDVPADAQPEATHLAAIVAACEVETSYYPEQVRTDRSAYQQLWAMFQDDRQAFIDYVSALSPVGAVGSEIGTFDVASGTVVWAYQQGLVGPTASGARMSDVVNV